MRRLLRIGQIIIIIIAIADAARRVHVVVPHVVVNDVVDGGLVVGLLRVIVRVIILCADEAFE